MGMIPQETIDQILDRLDIVEVISEYVQLKKAGRNFRACCPFHNEKTPSFIVSPDKQIYHCFGCHAGGNIVGFVMNYENLSFPEAIEMLAAKAGIELPRYEKRSDEETSLSSRLYDANELAAAFYQNTLMSAKGRRAQEYLKKRGISPDTTKTFRIGSAPDEWEGLRKFCGSKISRRTFSGKPGLRYRARREKAITTGSGTG